MLSILLGRESRAPPPREVNLERIVRFEPAYDKRDKNYGIHGVQVRFVLKGAEGAVQFLLYTNWQLPHIVKERDEGILVKASQGVYREPRVARIRARGLDLSEVEALLEKATRSIGEVRSGLDQIDLEVAYRPMPSNLGYHSPKPMYEGQTSISESCEFLDGKPCYPGENGLAAAKVFEVLLREGDAGVWRVLEDYYRKTFGIEKEG